MCCRVTAPDNLIVVGVRPRAPTFCDCKQQKHLYLNSMNISFLLGAGVSIPAGMPSTDDITKRVISGDNVMSHTDSKYYFGKPLFSHMGWDDEKVPYITQFISKIIIDELKKYDSSNSGLNYEDIYSVVNQVSKENGRIVNNPAIMPFIEIVQKRMQEIRTIFEKKEWLKYKLCLRF